MTEKRSLQPDHSTDGSENFRTFQAYNGHHFGAAYVTWNSLVLAYLAIFDDQPSKRYSNIWRKDEKVLLWDQFFKGLIQRFMVELFLILFRSIYMSLLILSRSPNFEFLSIKTKTQKVLPWIFELNISDGPLKISSDSVYPC